MTRLLYIRTTGWILIGILFLSLTCVVAADPNANPLTVVVTDSQTKENLSGAQVYLDGGYSGSTSTGILVIPGVNPGSHTIRVTSQGYQDGTRRFIYPSETTIQVMVSKGYLVSLNPNGPSAHAITIVFYPSSTIYDANNHSKLSTTIYTSNETRFRDDVMNVINNTYMTLDQFTSSGHSLPSDYRNYFNFYYYYNPALPADAFSGCAGSIPDSYWKDVSFSDATIILYPTYIGFYQDTSSQPSGCTQNFGPGRMVSKAPADNEKLIRHETGHAAFGLVDTYFGDTYYFENDPHPNVWASSDACTADARSNNRDPAQCRRIANVNSPTEVKNFWIWDPMPDIMAYSYNGRFGDAASQRIDYVLSQSRG